MSPRAKGAMQQHLSTRGRTPLFVLMTLAMVGCAVGVEDLVDVSMELSANVLSDPETASIRIVATNPAAPTASSAM